MGETDKRFNKNVAEKLKGRPYSVLSQNYHKKMKSWKVQTKLHTTTSEQRLAWKNDF